MDADRIRGSMQLYAELSTANITTLIGGKTAQGKNLRNYQMVGLLASVIGQGFLMLASAMVELFNVAPASEEKRH